MEFIETIAATKSTPAERVAIPDVVVAASHHRDLVNAFVAAAPSERPAIEAKAIARDAEHVATRAAAAKTKAAAEAAAAEAYAKTLSDAGNAPAASVDDQSVDDDTD